MLIWRFKTCPPIFLSVRLHRALTNPPSLRPERKEEKLFLIRSLDLLAPGSDGVFVLPVVIVIVDNGQCSLARLAPSYYW